MDTALRELHEETGLQATADRLTGVYYERGTDAHHFVFGCTAVGAVNPTPASPEISECAYWPVSELPRPIWTFTVQRIEDAVGGSSPILPTVIPVRELLD